MEQFFEFISNHPILIGAFVLLLILFIRNEVSRGGRTITAQELVNLTNREKAVIVDVRDVQAYKEGHILNSVNIPHAALKSRISEIEKHKNSKIIIACKMGQHAGIAGAALRKAGFQNVFRLRGGLAEWRNQNMPLVKG